MLNITCEGVDCSTAILASSLFTNLAWWLRWHSTYQQIAQTSTFNLQLYSSQQWLIHCLGWLDSALSLFFVSTCLWKLLDTQGPCSRFGADGATSQPHCGKHQSIRDASLFSGGGSTAPWRQSLIGFIVGKNMSKNVMNFAFIESI